MSYYISDHGKDCTCWTCNFGRNKEFFELIHNQKSRIAELEAEVERLKKPFIWKGDDLEELTEEVIRNRSIIDFEEGQG